MEMTNLPPLHPGLVHFPIALVTLSFFADLLGRIFGNAALRTTGWWTLVTGAVTSVLTLSLGYFDLNRLELNQLTRDYLELHMKVGWLLVVAVIALTLWRAHFQSRFERPIKATYFLAAFLATGLVLFQGWFGGEIVFVQGAGVAAAGQGTRPLAEAQKPLKKVSKFFQKVPGFDHRTASSGDPVSEEPAGATKNESTSVPQEEEKKTQEDSSTP